MLRGLVRLTWLEIKIFIREPLGVVGTVIVPVAAFVLLGRVLSHASTGAQEALTKDVPVFAAILIAVSAVLSLVTIIAIYREGGILKRLRATPLRPLTILSAHVIVKLLLTAATFVLMIAAGRPYYPEGIHAPLASFTLALLVATFSILSVGFLIASVVPTARFAQPIGSIILYPLIGISGLFIPVRMLPGALQPIARVQPFTFAVSLLTGIWQGDPWIAHGWDVAGLAVWFVLCSALASRVFRWE